MTDALYVGLMSGTSIDAIDSALVECRDDGISLRSTHVHPIPPPVADRIARLSQAGDNEIEHMGVLDRELGSLFAEAATALLEKAGCEARDVCAIGSHGQTIRHRPSTSAADGVPGFTLQIADPNTIAECTGITTVADFRRRDIAAGGEGAPLAPAFHAAAMALEGKRRAIINIGGIANVTLLDGDELVGGFDSGPGNTLLDHWIRQHGDQPFDRNGSWAACGQILQPLLDQMLTDEYFSRSGPRSTGKEIFNLEWLAGHQQSFPNAKPEDIQSTLAELTAITVARSIDRSGFAVEELYVCGGGAHNDDLMARLARYFPGVTVDTTAALGIDPDWVEAVTFAWLASRTMNGLAGNAPVVTGAVRECVLGAVYPGQK